MNSSELMAVLHRGAPAGLINPEALVRVLCITRTRLAKVCGVNANTIKVVTSPKLQAKLCEIAEVLRLATDLNGKAPEAALEAADWFRRHPLPEYGHRTPMQMVEEGRANVVMKHLWSISAGALG